MNAIHPVILAGGSGTRLWPVSRKIVPKQFAPLLGEASLFRTTVDRLADLAAPIVVTGAEHRFLAAEQLFDAGCDDATVMVEPEARDTAPAVLAAAIRLEDTPAALMLVCPSGHAIADTDAFRDALQAGAEAAARGSLVTFREKSEAGRAPGAVSGRRRLRNTGIFMFRVDAIIAAFEAHAPDLILPVRSALAAAKEGAGFVRLEASAWAKARHVSIDHAVMEKATGLAVVPLETGWSDLGSWRAVRDATDGLDNAVSGNALAIGCAGALIRSEDPGIQVVGLGLDCIAATGDAVLVAHVDEAERIREVVAELKTRPIGEDQDIYIPVEADLGGDVIPGEGDAQAA